MNLHTSFVPKYIYIFKGAGEFLDVHFNCTACEVCALPKKISISIFLHIEGPMERAGGGFTNIFLLQGPEISLDGPAFVRHGRRFY